MKVEFKGVLLLYTMYSAMRLSKSGFKPREGVTGGYVVSFGVMNDND